MSQHQTDSSGRQRRYAASHAKKAKKRYKIMVGVGSGVLALIVVAVVVIGTYLSGINTKIGFDDETSKKISEALTKPIDTSEPFYMLILGSDSRDPENSGAGRSDTIILSRLDVAATVPQVTLLSIPRDTEIVLPGYGTQKINAAFAYAGEAGAINAVSTLCNVDIAHVVEIDFNGVIEMVDTLGGVEVNVPLETSYKGITLQPGKQTLNGEQALTFSRSRNFPRGDYQRVINQRLLIQAVAKKVLASDTASLPALVNQLSECVKTDLSATDALQLLDKLRGMDPDNMYMDTIPSYTNFHDGASYIAVQEPEFSEMLARVDQGLSPTDPNAPVTTTTATGTSNDPGNQG